MEAACISSSYLINDVVSPSLRRHPQPVLEAASTLLDETVPLALEVFFPRFSINLELTFQEIKSIIFSNEKEQRQACRLSHLHPLDECICPNDVVPLLGMLLHVIGCPGRLPRRGKADQENHLAVLALLNPTKPEGK